MLASLLGSALVGCLPNNPSPNKDHDAIGLYEDMRAKTGQEHTHVEYCENDIVKLTISSRGQLISRQIFVPRKSIIHFRNRDTLNTYPLRVRIALKCLSTVVASNCQEASKVMGINVSLFDSTKRLLSGDLERDMVPADFRIENLHVLKKHERFYEMDHMNKGDFVYTNVSPLDRFNQDFPSIYIRYNSNRYARKDLKRCSWMLFTNESIRTSRVSDCSDLSDWKEFLLEFDAVSDKISAQGEFAEACR